MSEWPCHLNSMSQNCQLPLLLCFCLNTKTKFHIVYKSVQKPFTTKRQKNLLKIKLWRFLLNVLSPAHFRLMLDLVPLGGYLQTSEEDLVAMLPHNKGAHGTDHSLSQI